MLGTLWFWGVMVTNVGIGNQVNLEPARSAMSPVASAASGVRGSGKHSTPYAPGAVHDYMHAKVTVADDVCFIGSYNLSHAGEMNAEAVLEIADVQIAEDMARFIDSNISRLPV